MTESKQTRSDQDIILNARVTVYLDGMIMTRFTNGVKKIGQAGILTTLDDHCLRIIVRGKGQLGQVWPPRYSSGNIPYIPYSSFEKMSALWLYVASSEEKSSFPAGSSGKLTVNHKYTYDGLLDFQKLHPSASIKPNVLAPIKIPQGQFYMAQKAKFRYWQGDNSADKYKKEGDYSSLTGVAIDYQSSKKDYLILAPDPPEGSEDHEPSLLPAYIPLEPWAQYEVIIQNAPIVESPPPYHSMHFKKFYDAFTGVDEGDQYSWQHIRAYPNSPPCTSPSYGIDGDFDWDPKSFSSSAPNDAGHH